jgi:hypothetical protein
MHNRDGGRCGLGSEILHTNKEASRITQDVAELFAGDAFMEFRVKSTHSIKGLVYLS